MKWNRHSSANGSVVQHKTVCNGFVLAVDNFPNTRTILGRAARHDFEKNFNWDKAEVSVGVAKEKLIEFATNFAGFEIIK
jgi:hypothetical protein